MTLNRDASQDTNLLETGIEYKMINGAVTGNRSLTTNRCESSRPGCRSYVITWFYYVFHPLIEILHVYEQLYTAYVDGAQ
ncbi:hypothetical protein E4T56_gene19485 [Termitomyces sp. T112]|nr:hypothetical protein E4T56_gene19485 [Termitomyces sp. T112]